MTESTLPADYEPTTSFVGDPQFDSNGSPATVSLPSDSQDLTIDFGYRLPPAALGDFVWEDKNGNGVQEDGEPGIDGVSAFLYTCGGDGMVGTGDDVFMNSTSTDSNGKYLFPNLLPAVITSNSISR